MTTEEKKGEGAPVYVCPCYGQQTPPDDEISLIDLVNVLVRKKKLIILITAVVTLAAVIYAYRLPKVYRAEIFFLPPTATDIGLLDSQDNLADPFFGAEDQPQMLKNLTPTRERVFDLFLENIQSRQVQRQVFDELFPIREGQDRDVFFEDIRKKIAVHQPKRKSFPQVPVSFEYKDPALAARFLNRLGKMAESEVASMVVLDIQNKIDQEKSRLEAEREFVLAEGKRAIQEDISKTKEEIGSLTKRARLSKQHILDRLERAKAVAKQAGISEPLVSGYPLSATRRYGRDALSGENLRVFPDYLLGEKILQAEIEEVRTLQPDAFFSPSNWFQLQEVDSSSKCTI